VQPLGGVPRSVRVPGCPGGVVAGRPGVCPYTSVASIGRRGAGVLRCPEALAFAPDGDLYVADQFSHVVQRFSPAGRFLGQWGSYGSGPGQFGAVDGLAVAASGDVYVLDASHARIERFSPAGRLLGEWGRPGSALGEFDFGPGYGPDKPPGGGIAVGGGYVYVSDSANNRIVRFALDGSHPLLWGRPGSAPGELSSPRGLAVAGGVVYVADEANHRIQALSLAGRPLYSEGTFGKAPGEFVNPFGVAVHGSRVYAVDDNNNRIVVLSRALHYVEEWSGEGAFQLSYIRAAAVSPSGHVYVADTGHERVVAFTATGRGLLAFGTPGTSPGQLIAPLGVATDGAGGADGAFVVETYGSRSPIYRFGPSWRYLGEWQRGGGAIVGSHWFGPTAAAVAPDGSLWVTDPRNGIVRHLSSEGVYLGALGAEARLLEPNGVALAPSGHMVYVADTGAGRIQRFSAAYQPLGRLGSVALDRPVAIAVAPDGSVYVADAGRHRVFELSPAGALLASWGGPGGAPGRFEDPSGIAVDSAGDVFVADRLLDRVQKFTAGGRLLAMWGTAGGGAGQLSLPSGLAANCRGDVLVADTANNRVQVFAGAASRGSCVVR
jgi:tripartite motif-containing protein 71